MTEDDLAEKLKQDSPEFRAWVETLPDKHWAKYDLSACRLGWEAGRAALQQESLKAVVKPLEWVYVGRVVDKPSDPNSLVRQYRGCHSHFGRYGGSYSVQEIEPGGRWGFWNTWTSDREPEGVFPTLHEAKAAAQADYEARILSALAHPLHQPAPEAGKPDRRHDIARIVIDAVRHTRQRPPGLRGPYVFDDAELDEIIASYDAAPAPEPQAPVPDGVSDAVVQVALAAAQAWWRAQPDGTPVDEAHQLGAMRAALAAANQGSGK